MLKFCIAVDDLEMVKISCKNNKLNDLNHLENSGHRLSEKKLIAKFNVEDREFTLYCYECEISLALKSKFQKSKAQPLKDAWLSFADEPTFEDVNEQIDVFAVMQLARYHLLRYIQKNKLSYFYFHASTARKARIYPRFSARLIQDLPNYNFCQENQSFYFFKKA